MLKYPEGYTIAFVHKGGCNKVAFYYRTYVPSDTLKAADAIFPDGTKPKSGEIMLCGNCHDAIMLYELKHGDNIFVKT